SARRPPPRCTRSDGVCRCRGATTYDGRVTTPAAPGPGTDRADSLPASWNPGEVESEVYERWVDAGYFEADPSSDKPAYSVVLAGVRGPVAARHGPCRDRHPDARRPQAA